MEEDGRPTTAIDGNELRGLVAQARDGRAALEAQLAAAAAAPRRTESIPPIVMILDRPAKVVDDHVQRQGKSPAVSNPEKFRAIAPAAAVVAALDAAIAAHVAHHRAPAAAPVEQARITGLEVLQLADEPRRVVRLAPLVRHATGVSIAQPKSRLDVYLLAMLVVVAGVVAWLQFA